MNEKIKELANKAGISYLYDYSLDGHAVVCNLSDIEKLAGLILKECLSICDKEKAEYQKFRQVTDDFTEKNIYAEGEVAAMGIKYKIKHLFGVKNDQ